MAEDAHLTQLDKPIEEGSEPYGKFKIAKNTIANIAYLCQDRVFSEEVDRLEELGGE